MSAKTKVRIEEILTYTSLPYSLFDSKNKVIFQKGEEINSKLIAKISIMELFRLSTLGNDDSPGEFTKISKETVDFVVHYTKDLWNNIEKDNKPPVTLLYEIRDRLVSEVIEHIHNINHIGELRIYDNNYNISHSLNVCSISTAIALKLGYEDKDLKDIALGGFLHDIGKSKIPPQILNKPASLTFKETSVIRLHPVLGYKIIKETYKLPEKIARIALDHQERYDGSGYSKGLECDKIDKFAQIVSLADVYDASMSDKVYARAKTPKDILKELLKTSPSFNPRILYTLVHMINYNTGNMK